MHILVLQSTLLLLLQPPPLQGRPAAHKVLVVTPSTLTQNWADEARKWLGHERLRALVLQPGADGKQQVWAACVLAPCSAACFAGAGDG